MVDSEDRYSTEKATSVQSTILYDCDAEALSNSIRPRPVSSFDDEVENCPGAKGRSVQISLSRPIRFFMVKPRFCPSQDQSSPVQSRRSSSVLAKSSPINQLLIT
ncbi:hypothetical protein DY000_02014327 [Brassica cretica]|uniref:DUF4005 domain-containing protein n=1 Tax=Brassica cretica TaxID=69181 RepID=A0ABQ7CWI9_BRACR|nr:hypothetical protein DY000_02014327 [Brassica cretica]